MKNIVGIIEKATLGFSTLAEHEGYVIRLLVKEGKKNHSLNLISLTGGYPCAFNAFCDKVCSVMGEQDGLVFKAKMIQYFPENGEGIIWSV